MGRFNKLLEDGRLPIVVPFLKEWIFGDSDVAKVIRRNKTTTILLVVNILLLIMFFYMSNQAIEKHKMVLLKNAQLEEVQKKISQIEAIEGMDTSNPLVFADQVLKLNQNYRQCKTLTTFLQKQIETRDTEELQKYFDESHKKCK